MYFSLMRNFKIHGVSYIIKSSNAKCTYLIQKKSMKHSKYQRELLHVDWLSIFFQALCSGTVVAESDKLCTRRSRNYILSFCIVSYIFGNNYHAIRYHISIYFSNEWIFSFNFVLS